MLKIIKILNLCSIDSLIITNVAFVYLFWVITNNESACTYSQCDIILPIQTAQNSIHTIQLVQYYYTLLRNFDFFYHNILVFVIRWNLREAILKYYF